MGSVARRRRDEYRRRSNFKKACVRALPGAPSIGGPSAGFSLRCRVRSETRANRPSLTSPLYLKLSRFRAARRRANTVSECNVGKGLAGCSEINGLDTGKNLSKIGRRLLCTLHPPSSFYFFSSRDPKNELCYLKRYSFTKLRRGREFSMGGGMGGDDVFFP